MQTNHLKPEVGERAYAKAQIREVWDGDKFIQHLYEHNGVFSRGTVKGVVSDVCNCIVEQVLNGNKIFLGELGSFSASLSCDSADDMKSFTAAKIKAVNLVFTPGPDFENMISKAVFNPVTSRKLQAAALKAEKAGDEILDIDAAKAKKKDETTPDGNTGGSGSDEGGSTTPDENEEW